MPSARSGVALQHLNEDQRRAVAHRGDALCIIASAGSGKTAVLAHRIANLIETGDARASSTLAISFTRAAANELGTRVAGFVRGESIVNGTFHSIGLSSLRRYWERNRIQPPRILPSRYQLLVKLLASETVADATAASIGRTRGAAGASANASRIDVEIGWAKARSLSPSQYEGAVQHGGRRVPLPTAEVVRVFSAYEDHKRRSGLIDLDDILLEMVRLLSSDRAFMEEERYLYETFFVDEFQDINPSQLELLVSWVGKRDSLTVVGDPNQSIYAWNGSDPGIIREFPSIFAPATVVTLPLSYRSTPEILTAAAAVLPRVQHPAVEIAPVAFRQEEPDSTPTVASFESAEEEIDYVCRRLRRMQYTGVPYASMAVLARTNALLAPLERSLGRMGIPVHAASATLLSPPAARAAMAEARRGGAHSVSQLCDLLVELLSEVIPTSDPGGSGHDGSPPQANSASDPGALRRLLGAALKAKASNALMTLDEFASMLDDGAFSLQIPEDAVTLATFHRAKGLEFHHVHIIGAENGIVPLGGNARSDQDEERRLLYVAMTRAVNSLELSWVRYRQGDRRTKPGIRSPLLDHLDEAESAEERVRARSLRRVVALSKELEVDHDGIDPMLLSALNRWREEASEAASLPPWEIASDRCLRELARRRPADLAGVARVSSGSLSLPRYQRQVLQILRSSP